MMVQYVTCARKFKDILLRTEDSSRLHGQTLRFLDIMGVTNTAFSFLKNAHQGMKAFEKCIVIPIILPPSCEAIFKSEGLKNKAIIANRTFFLAARLKIIRY